MFSQYQWIRICLALSSIAHGSLLKSGFSETEKRESTALLSRASVNTTFDDEGTDLSEAEILHGNWLQDAEEGNPTLPHSNLSLLNTTVAGAPRYFCNGKAYGRNLNIRSCAKAVDLMADLHEPLTFGERQQGKWDINLPFRFLSPDGLCAIDISHQKEFLFDTMMPADMKTNAQVLVSICVHGDPNQGGIASNLGQNGALAIRMVPYRPSVECGDHGSGPPPGDCRDVLDEMPAGDSQQRFGPAEDATVQFTLPLHFTSMNPSCGFTADILSGSDVGSWYQLWAAAVAVLVMCVEVERARGVGTRLGKEKKLFVALEHIQPDQPALVLPSVNTSFLNLTSS